MKRWIWMAALAGIAACGGPSNSTNSHGSMPPETRLSSAMPEVRPDTLIRTGGGASSGGGALAAGLPLASGLYRLTDIEGDFKGLVSLLCYTPGHGNQYVGEAITYSDDPGACDPMSSRATANGWVNTMGCNDSELGRVTYTFAGERQSNGDLRVADTAVDGQGRTPSGLEPRIVMTRRAGQCPAGWRAGDFMIISRPGDNGRYTAHQIGHDPDANSPSYDALPPNLAAFLH